MTMASNVSEGKIRQLVSEYADDRDCLLDFLRFWGRHPSTRFNQAAIIHALDCQEPGHVERALTYLINREVIREQGKNQGTCYRLTEAEPWRSELLNIARFDWSQQNLIQEKIIHRQGEIYA